MAILTAVWQIGEAVCLSVHADILPLDIYFLLAYAPVCAVQKLARESGDGERLNDSRLTNSGDSMSGPMHYWVYYHDDYYEKGGVGLEPFASEADAMKFIEARLLHHPQETLDSYQMIAGVKIHLAIQQTVTKIVRTP